MFGALISDLCVVEWAGRPQDPTHLWSCGGGAGHQVQPVQRQHHRIILGGLYSKSGLFHRDKTTCSTTSLYCPHLRIVQ